jgi:hypothetical protein
MNLPRCWELPNTPLFYELIIIWILGYYRIL